MGMAKCDEARMGALVEEWASGLKGAHAAKRQGKAAQQQQQQQQQQYHAAAVAAAGHPGAPLGPKHVPVNIRFLEVGEGGRYLNNYTRQQTSPADKPKEIKRWMDEIASELGGEAPTNPETHCSSDAFTDGSEAETDPSLASPGVDAFLYDPAALASNPTQSFATGSGFDGSMGLLAVPAVQPQPMEPSAAMNLWMDALRTRQPPQDAPVPAAAAQLRVGSVVSAGQIRLSPSLNGKQGTVVGVDAARARAEIRFPPPFGTVSLRVADIMLLVR
eukprot:TRINITY_DN2802_c0_g2_i4.p1 TRINITY_DN2802_c0_g2~~TRINITY_DN2802_c0_g2_i4.p1  ORF type:complete len:274 (+),score=107.36 TRINITY_DN2802_c0_g2_i4:85-906(+)